MIPPWVFMIHSLTALYCRQSGGVFLFLIFNCLFIVGWAGSSLLWSSSAGWVGCLAAAVGGVPLPPSARASHGGAFSCCGPQALGVWASVVVAHGLRGSVARGTFVDKGSHPCPLCWQADSYPLCHQGSPAAGFQPHHFLSLQQPCMMVVILAL